MKNAKHRNLKYYNQFSLRRIFHYIKRDLIERDNY